MGGVSRLHFWTYKVPTFGGPLLSSSWNRYVFLVSLSNVKVASIGDSAIPGGWPCLYFTILMGHVRRERFRTRQGVLKARGHC